MCDTLAVRRNGAIWFAKNSDREPAEVQRTEIYPAVSGDRERSLRCTHIEIEQSPSRRGVVLSRPQWMWGAEMGVNDAGVAIGNEAVFSKRVLRRGEALLGMDLVRLGLERSASAREAVGVIISLLEQYGQGGGAGYRDRNFRYDNSFLIADALEIYVLETAGRDWAVKQAQSGWSISNGYTFREDYDCASRGTMGDFKAKNAAFAMPVLACAASRRAATGGVLAAAPEKMSLALIAGALRKHAAGDGFSRGSNNDVCMHAGGFLRPHASTSSMIARLKHGDTPRIAFTGTPHPCISLFKPATFVQGKLAVCDEALFARGVAAARKAAADREWRAAIRTSIADIEPSLLGAIERGDAVIADEIAARWVSVWLSD